MERKEVWNVAVGGKGREMKRKEGWGEKYLKERRGDDREKRGMGSS